MPSSVTITGRPLVKGVSIESPHSMRRAWGMIFRFMRRYITMFAIGITLVFIESLLSVFVPNYISDITDLISDGLYTGDIDLDAVSRIGIVILLLYLFAHGATFLRNFVMADVAERVAGDMRSALNRKLSRLPMDYYDSSDKGDVISRFTNDSDTVGSALNRSISVFLHGIFVLILCTAMMFITNVKLTIVSIAAALIGFGVCFMVMRYTRKYYRAQQRNIGSMYGLISEIYSSHSLVQSYSGEGNSRRKFDSINEKLRSSGFRSEITMGLLPAFMQFSGNIGYVLVCIVGSVMVIQGEITIGMVVAFILFEKMFMGPLDMISSSLGNLQAVAGEPGALDDLDVRLGDAVFTAGVQKAVQPQLPLRDAVAEHARQIHHAPDTVLPNQVINHLVLRLPGVDPDRHAALHRAVDRHRRNARIPNHLPDKGPGALQHDLVPLHQHHVELRQVRQPVDRVLAQIRYRPLVLAEAVENPQVHVLMLCNVVLQTAQCALHQLIVPVASEKRNAVSLHFSFILSIIKCFPFSKYRIE